MGSAEYEVHGANGTECGPQVIEAKGLPYIYMTAKGTKHDQGDYLLQDLELPQGERGIAYPVRRNLKQIFEESYSPAHEGRDVPRAMREIPQRAYQANVMKPFESSSKPAVRRKIKEVIAPPASIAKWR